MSAIKTAAGTLWLIEVQPRNPVMVERQFVNPQRIMWVHKEEGDVWVITLDDDSQWVTSEEMLCR